MSVGHGGPGDDGRGLGHEGREGGAAGDSSFPVPRSPFPGPGPIHHIGVVVADIAAVVAQYRALGFTGGEVTRVAEQNVDIAALRAGESWVEILTPLEQDSPIGRFLATRGPGFHHVAYLVDDLAATLRELETAGVELIDHAPRTGLHDWRVAFVHPRACAGVLTELVERGSVREH